VSTTGTQLANISTRALVGTGANIIIPGFVISGTGSEQLLARGDGPALTGFGVSGALAQPSLGVFNSSGSVIASNTGWDTNSNPTQLASAAATVGAFALASGSADSALIVNLSAGAYTMQLSGVNNSTGVALAEVDEGRNLKWGGQRDSNPRLQDSQNWVHIDGKRLMTVQLLPASSDRANAMWHDVAQMETPRGGLGSRESPNAGACG